jgi:hypothetical protein
MVLAGSAQRKTSMQAAVEALPGVEKLSTREHELCIAAKLFPNQHVPFLQCHNNLQSAC